MYQELVEYRQHHGHCLVPHAYHKSPRLGRWVKRQRYQYTLMLEGDPTTTMTPTRVQALKHIGFVWDPQSTVWYERLSELKEFKARYHHTNVPVQYRPNPPLAIWVKFQRRQYKLYQEGKPSVMSPERLHELAKVGFVWELRKVKPRKQQSMLNTQQQ